jgi:hypothetical protein
LLKPKERGSKRRKKNGSAKRPCERNNKKKRKRDSVKRLCGRERQREPLRFSKRLSVERRKPASRKKRRDARRKKKHNGEPKKSASERLMKKLKGLPLNRLLRRKQGSCRRPRNELVRARSPKQWTLSTSGRHRSTL